MFRACNSMCGPHRGAATCCAPFHPLPIFFSVGRRLVILCISTRTILYSGRLTVSVIYYVTLIDCIYPRAQKYHFYFYYNIGKK